MKEFDKIRNEVSAIVDEETIWAEKQDHPAPSTALDFNYSTEPPLAETPFNKNK